MLALLPRSLALLVKVPTAAAAATAESKEEAFSNPKIFLIIFSPSSTKLIHTQAKIPAARVFVPFTVFATAFPAVAIILNPGINDTILNIVSKADGSIKEIATLTKAKYIIQ